MRVGGRWSHFLPQLLRHNCIMCIELYVIDYLLLHESSSIFYWKFDYMCMQFSLLSSFCLFCFCENMIKKSLSPWFSGLAPKKSLNIKIWCFITGSFFSLKRNYINAYDVCGMEKNIKHASNLVDVTPNPKHRGWGKVTWNTTNLPAQIDKCHRSNCKIRRT